VKSMGEIKGQQNGPIGGQGNLGTLAHQVSQLLQQQMDKLVDVPLADWSLDEWDKYRERRKVIRKLRTELEGYKVNEPS
jgi:hypothetical protein